MTVNVAQGDPVEFLLASGTHVGGLGRAFPLNNITWIDIASLHISITTTATAGTRGFIFQFQDAQSNTLSDTPSGLGQTASTTQRYSLGPGLPLGGQNLVSTQPIPFPTSLPPGSQLFIFDGSNVDANDALATTGVLIYTQ